MTNLRAAFSALVVALLVAGSAGAAWASLNGDAQSWAVQADAAPIRALALAILIVAIVLVFIPDRMEPEA